LKQAQLSPRTARLPLAQHRMRAHPTPDHVRFSRHDLHAILERRPPIRRERDLPHAAVPWTRWTRKADGNTGGSSLRAVSNTGSIARKACCNSRGSLRNSRSKRASLSNVGTPRRASRQEVVRASRNPDAATRCVRLSSLSGNWIKARMVRRPTARRLVRGTGCPSRMSMVS
jgi:hypothetical protein